MKIKSYILFLLAMLMSVAGMEAQSVNRLAVPDLTALPGSTVALPLNMDNAAEIVAVQFVLQVPEGSTLDATTAQLTNRAADHVVTMRDKGSNQYRCMIYSPTNSSLIGRAGQLMTVSIHVSDAYVEGREYPFVLSDVVLVQPDGSNALTDVQAGVLTMKKGPDLYVHDVQSDAAAYAPASTAIVSWQVSNIGVLATEAGWTEYLSLKNDDGTSTLLSTLSFDETLAPGAVVSRQAEVKLPDILGLDGEARFEVEVKPLSATGESQGMLWNNIAAAPTTVQLSKLLTLVMPTAAVEETNTRPIRCTLTRSGNRTNAETFNVVLNPADRLSMPTTVTIPAGQSAVSFYVRTVDNDVLDDDSIVSITIKGNGYPDVDGRIIVADNEYPDLKVVASKNSVREGETFQLTISTTRPSMQDIAVTLSSETRGRFKFPAQVTIPAGEASVSVDVTAVDDDLPALTLSNAFTAYAPAHNKGEAIVILEDNDVPVLELTLTPNKVSESDGPIAVAAVLRRTGVTDNKITVKLSDDSHGGIYYATQTIELAKGVEEAHLNLGPIDNVDVDGDRVVNITAAVYISSCSCSASGESAGVVSAQLTILDDDGPALKLTSAVGTLSEGASTTLTVTRNTTTTKAQKLTLTSDHDDRLDYEHSITIPKGKDNVSVQVTSLANSVQGDSFTAVFTAQANGFSAGTCFVMVTDQTLPDARVSIAADKTEAEVGSEVNLTVTVANEGAAPLPAGTEVRVYTFGATRTLRTTKELAVGDQEELTMKVTLPSTIGSARCYAVVNENSLVSELNHNNNTSTSLTLQTISPFGATAQTDKAVYAQGETVTITGQLTGSKIANQTVDVYVMGDGLRKTLTVLTDAQGAFSTTWTPQDAQFGHFRVGACYPGAASTEEMASFDVYGLHVTLESPVYAVVGEAYRGTITLNNPCTKDLTNVRVEVVSSPENCTVEVGQLSLLNSQTTNTLTYTLNTTSPSSGSDWQTVELKVSTGEGLAETRSLRFFARSPQAQLEVSERSITTTIQKGSIRDYELTVTNVGKGNSGAITLDLPSWMSSATGMTIGSLATNETASIIIRMTAEDDMQLNVPVTGTLGINCENANGVGINYHITPVSNAEGTLTVDVADEYTYATAEAPHVAGSSVEVRNPVTNALVAQGVTGADGLYTVILPEGYYRLIVTSDKHDSYDGTILVSPEMVTRKTINLSVQPITISWDVQETEVEDEYEIVTTVQYETNVPMPVVELTVPKKIDADQLADGESLIFYALLTNRGLIAAKDAQLILPEGFTHLTFEPLAEYTGLTIAPQQSVTIPVKVTRVATALVKAQRRSDTKPVDNDPCVGQPGTLYFWDCGLDRKWHRYGVAMQVGSCNSNDSTTWETVHDGDVELIGGWPTGLAAPNWGYYNFSSSTNKQKVSKSEDKGCEPCQNRFLIDLVDCGLQLVPAYKVLKAVVGCAQSVMNAAGVLTNEKSTGVQKAGALLEAATTCAAAKGAGKGDKNASRAKKREEAIESIINTLGQITGNIAQKEDGDTVNWSNVVFDNLAGLGANLMSLVGFDGEDWEEIFCPLKLLKPCDLQGDSVSPPAQIRRRAQQQSSGGYPAYLSDFRNSVSYGLADMLALEGMRMELYGDALWLDLDAEELSDFVLQFRTLQNENGYLPEDKMSQLLDYKPTDVTDDDVRAFITRWNNTVLEENTDNKIDFDKAFSYFRLIELSEEQVSKRGYSGLDECISVEYDKALEKLEEAKSSVCSSITLQFKQTLVMTRQAFQGTLTVFNGHETEAMQDVKLSLVITSEDGDIATEHEFDVKPQSAEGFGYTGELSLDQGWTLDAQATGTANILFTPSKYAAPTVAKRYSFGGTLTYIDPFNGLEVTRTLTPVTLTVNPTADLVLTYFMQRDVYGDDPLTLDVVEPSVPAEFALLINNIGYGDAKDVRMETLQPEITVNEKGLDIDFHLVSSQLNGGTESPVIGSKTATKFGDIPAHSTVYAQWWFESSLLGHFTDYNVEVRPISYQNPDMSLINLEQTSIKELIRSIDVETDGGKLAGFLVNEARDAEDRPDMLYLSDGETANVTIAAQTTVTKTSATTYELTIVPVQSGWNYVSISDPTMGYSTLQSVVRKRDGKSISLRNFWQTDRTLIDGKDWLYDNNLHCVDLFEAASETYVLTFEAAPQTPLQVESIEGEGIPAEGDVAEAPVETVDVTFNKPIDPTSFTGEDITMAVQAVKQDASLIGISTTDNKKFTLDLSAVNAGCGNGYYTLNVQTAGITDADGYQGKTGKTVSWIMFRGGLVQLLTSVWPANSGNISRETSNAVKAFRAPASADEDGVKYGSTVTLTATPAVGYEFTNWTLNGDVVATEPTFEAQALSDLDIVANFKKKTYAVAIDDASEGGTVTGAYTGIYEYGTQLNLVAEPDADFVWTGWTVNGEAADGGDKFTVTVDKELDIKPLFRREYYHQQLSMQRGWNWVSTYLDEARPVAPLARYSTRLLGQFDELIRDPQYGIVGSIESIEPATAYKVNALSPFDCTYDGRLLDLATSPVNVKTGWNWVGYPFYETRALSTLLPTADEGDYIAGQEGFTEYADGYWQGTLETLVPGAGYMYKSARDKALSFDMSVPTAGVKAFARGEQTATEASPIDVHRYPNTMNVTAVLAKDGEPFESDGLTVYAIAGDETRGIGRQVGNLLYVTVYGEDPVDISFVAQDNDSGETFIGSQPLTFVADVVGSRKAPYVINVGRATSIDDLRTNGATMTVYGIDGVLVHTDATPQTLRRLPKGIYIVNRQKCIIK